MSSGGVVAIIQKNLIFGTNALGVFPAVIRGRLRITLITCSG